MYNFDYVKPGSLAEDLRLETLPQEEHIERYQAARHEPEAHAENRRTQRRDPRRIGAEGDGNRGNASG